MPKKSMICFLGIALSFIAWRVVSGSQAEKDSNPVGSAAIQQDDDEAVARRDFMRLKLMYSKNILEGLTTGDFEHINAAVKELRLVTDGAQWVAIDNDQYRKLTEEFKTATERLAESAETGNIEATAMRFYQMSTSCIDCHKHIRKAKYDL